MCITVNHANLSNTKILSLPLENGNHFLAYSNKVKNLSGKPNAMILPIPGETSPELFYNTESYRDFMDEITKKCDYVEDYLGMKSRGMSKGIGFDRFDIGQYTVGLAKDFQGIRDFMDQLPEEKKPEISEELKKFFEEKYNGWSFAICVFDSDKTIDAQPIAFEYKPFIYDAIYFPTVDGHDGGAPDLNAPVDVDHTFIYEHTGSMEIPAGKMYQYFQKTVTLDAKVPDFLAQRKYRAIFMRGRHQNGDTFINALTMKDSNFADEPQLKRVHPAPVIAA